MAKATTTRTRQLRGTTPENAEPSRPKVLVFGKAGVGKTWASLDWPSVYYIDTEGGANLPEYIQKLQAVGAAYFGPEHGSQDLDTVIEEVITLASTEHPYKTLVIDSLTHTYNTSIGVTEDKMLEAKQELGFGRERKDATSKVRKLMRWLDKVDMNVILICHEKDKWQDGKVVGVTFDCWDKLEYQLHLALHIRKTGKGRDAVRKAVPTKSRMQESGLFPEGESFNWSYDEMASRFGKALLERTATVFHPPTDEEIAEFERLAKAVNIPEDLLQKRLASQKAETLAEVRREVLVDWIGKMREAEQQLAK